MSRFFVTNDEGVKNKSLALNEQAELSKGGHFIDNGTHVVSYEKRALTTVTSSSMPGSNFVAVSGTVIYDGHIGQATLSKIYHDYVSEGTRFVRDKALGHYAICIGYEGNIYIFCDPNSVYEVYYTTNQVLCVSNSLYLCATSMADPVVNSHGLYERAIESTEIGASTIYCDINRLSCTEQIVINTKTESYHIEETSTPRKTWSYNGTSLDNIVQDYTKRIREVFSEVSDATTQVGVQATGGLDSRTVLAGLLDQNVYPLVLYGTGNSQITNTRKRDEHISKQYADKYDLAYYNMDWSGDYPVNIEALDNLFEKYGFGYSIYGATPSFFREFDSGFPSNPELLMSGYGFGVFSNDYFWEDNANFPISFEKAVENIFSDAKIFDNDEFVCKRYYIQHLVANCKNALSRLGCDISYSGVLDREQMTKTVQLLNGRPQSGYVNVVNEFTYHLAPFATYKLGRPMIDFPPRVRAGEKIRVSLLSELCPGLLDIEIYSGGRSRRVDKNKKLVDAGNTAKSVLERSMPESLVRILKNLFRRLKISPVDQRILRTAIDRLTADGVVSPCFELSNYYKDIRYIVRLLQLEHGAERIGFTEIHRHYNDN